MLLGEMGVAEFFDPALVAAAAERCGEEGLDARFGHLDPDQARPHGDDVGVIVLAGETRGERLRNESGAAGGVAIGGARMGAGERARG